MNKRLIKEEIKGRFERTTDLFREVPVGEKWGHVNNLPENSEYWKKNITNFKKQKWWKTQTFWLSSGYVVSGVLTLIPGTQAIGIGLAGVLSVFKGTKLRKSANKNTLADKPVLKQIFDIIIKILEALKK